MDFAGPIGWEACSVPLGRITDLGGGPADGARAADLTALVDAARQAALAEDRLVFGGYDDGAIRAIAPESPHESLAISDHYEDYPSLVARAVQRLQESGIDGPYGLALGRCAGGASSRPPNGAASSSSTTSAASSEGSIVPASAVSGGIVLSVRGGDYVLTCGQDLSVGYLTHDASTVTLYLEESITFQVVTPEAAVPLVYR